MLGTECEVLVMQLLGPSVEALWWAAGAGTGLETGSALRLGAGMLRCLRGLHACGWTHNDVKPANFCMGPGGKGGEGGKGGAASRVHLVDFGLCAPVAAAAAARAAALAAATHRAGRVRRRGRRRGRERPCGHAAVFERGAAAAAADAAE